MKQPPITDEIIKAIPAVSDAIDNWAEGLMDDEDASVPRDHASEDLDHLQWFDVYLHELQAWHASKKKRRTK